MRNLAIILIPATALAFLTAVHSAEAAIVYDQSPSASGLIAHPSPAGTSVLEAADSVVLASDATIAGIVFWGDLQNSGSFRVSFYNAAVGGGPSGVLGGGAISSEEIAVSNMVVKDSGFDAAGGLDVYEYRADLTNPVSLIAGTYYFSTYSLQLDTWGWYSQENANTHYRYEGGDPPTGWALVGDNLAFQLHDTSVVPEPGSIAVLSFAAVGLALGVWRRRRKQKPVTD